MTPAAVVAAGWLLVALVMAVLWNFQRTRTNAGVVDVAWSLATGVLGVWFAVGADGDPARRGIVAGMAGIWSGRLGVYLWRRVAREAEDGRYRDLRGRWGSDAQRKLFWFFQVQAVWAVMFAVPMLAAARNPHPPGGLDAIGVGFWMVALAGESIADRQLARFRRDPGTRGQVCREGLWRYSRHPNYFFEWLHWWAYVFLGIGSTLWWIPPIGVAVMLLFLTKVTGIPPTEAQALRSRGQAYREYQRTTSAFFPWPPSEDTAR